MPKKPELILASGSQTRRTMLEKAGVSFRVDAADVDERTLKDKARAAGQSVEETALLLARAKAEKVAVRHENAFVLGADQMLACEGRWFDKAQNRAEAEEQLRFLSGKTHRLITAAVLLGGEAWVCVEEARLTMRTLDNAFISAYCDKLGESLYGSVGCYAVEGLGAQLFQKIEGDFFVILGLPLLPLLEALRVRKIL